MNKYITIFLLASAMVFSACSGKKENTTVKHDANPEVMKLENNAVEFYYVCPMESHKHITSSKAGACADCGMQMVQVLPVEPEHADFFACPMREHSHLRSDKPGKCSECGMGLHAMKLKTS